jgi:hypothetical protein
MFYSFLILGGCISLHSLLWLVLGVQSIATNFNFILFFTSLNVSASTGHLQVKYTQSFLKSYCVYNGSGIRLYSPLFHIMLCNNYNLKFNIKIADNVFIMFS